MAQRRKQEISIAMAHPLLAAATLCLLGSVAAECDGGNCDGAAPSCAAKFGAPYALSGEEGESPSLSDGQLSITVSECEAFLHPHSTT